MPALDRLITWEPLEVEQPYATVTDGAEIGIGDAQFFFYDQSSHEHVVSVAESDDPDVISLADWEFKRLFSPPWVYLPRYWPAGSVRVDALESLDDIKAKDRIWIIIVGEHFARVNITGFVYQKPRSAGIADRDGFDVRIGGSRNLRNLVPNVVVDDQFTGWDGLHVTVVINGRVFPPVPTVTAESFDFWGRLDDESADTLIGSVSVDEALSVSAQISIVARYDSRFLKPGHIVFENTQYTVESTRRAGREILIEAARTG